MFVLVTGGSGSGKSEYAEQLLSGQVEVSALAEKLLSGPGEVSASVKKTLSGQGNVNSYAALAEKKLSGLENACVSAKLLLPDAGNLEGERYYIATMKPFGEEGRRRVEKHRKQREGRCFKTIECYRELERLSLPKGCDVLLECMSNLLANEMFDGKEDTQGREPEEPSKKIMRGVENLLGTCRHLVVVTNEVFSDGITYDDSTEEYIRLLGQINRQLAQRADLVVEVVYSIPVCHKITEDFLIRPAAYQKGIKQDEPIEILCHSISHVF